MSVQPFVSYDEHTSQWTLEHDYTALAVGRMLLVPGGFTFDLASIPRPFWNIIAPFELGLGAPLVHDWLYRHGGIIRDCGANCDVVLTRAEADKALLDLMTEHGVSRWKRWTAYAAVRCFGGRCWVERRP